MAEKKEKVATEAVAEEKTAVKKTAAKSAAKTETKAPAKKPAAAKSASAKTEAKPAAKKPAAKVEESKAVEVAATEAPKAAPAKKTAKKASAKAKAPLYINGRYVVEKQLPQKPQKGSSPYEAATGKVKVTLIKSTVGCLDGQIATVKALGLTKIRTSNVLPDNAAIRGMIFKVKHLVAVENVK